ncbi:MAG: tRNA (adenosine(37)-N6)-threonylcarbamoyltransferase complex dimerization subunit type 1 TsaB [Chloroflexi bacterium]|nr:tRNA (adenosine(37)-N6)-threonylcarbamoyltransferase complex dimerization subunit type 1 TsaB [Chloroflexota bacterium]
MKVLGLDTSSYANAIGVVDDGRVLADFTYEARTDSLQKIVTNIDAVLSETGLALDDIDGFGIGLGPGSWTGIRVGVTVGKMLAYSTGKPACGVTSLEALAYDAREVAETVCTVISAGARDAVYAALFQTGEGGLSRVGDYYVGDVAGLARLGGRGAVYVSAWPPLGEKLAEALGAGPDYKIINGVPRGGTIALLSAARLALGQPDDALALAPLYLKESTARAMQAGIIK